MDKYDVAIEYLKRHPEQIWDAWQGTDSHPSGCLFQFCGSGCLTMIKSDAGPDGETGRWSSYTPELSAAIIADERIPTQGSDITVSHLSVFAEWQRRLDATPHRKA
jgi:hypothetical protein